MKKFTETIEVKDPATGKVFSTCKVGVILTWYLYPLIFCQDEKYLQIPNLKNGFFAQEGLMQIDLPHIQQRNWFKCLLSWNRYRDKYVVPMAANLEHYRLTGMWANGHVSYKNGHLTERKYTVETI